MANNELADVFSSLFTAPVEASLTAEEGYRNVWIKWLNQLLAFAEKAKITGEPLKLFLEKQLDLAPVMKFEAFIDAGVSLRITSLRQKQGGGSLGIQVGVLQASGSFSFASQDTKESVLQARATYTLANVQQISLKDYLGTALQPLQTTDNVKDAIKFLETKAPATQTP